MVTVVVSPADRPEAGSPDAPEIVIEDEVGVEHRVASRGDRTNVDPSAPGSHRIAAITADGGCHDTAGVTGAGNIDVRDGDTILLVDTGEICD